MRLSFSLQLFVPIHNVLPNPVLYYCYCVWYVLCRSPVPVVVTEMVRDNEEGLPEKDLIKNNAYHL